MLGLYQDPQGEKVFEKSNSAITLLGNTEHLRRRIQQLEALVAKQQVGGVNKESVCVCDCRLLSMAVKYFLNFLVAKIFPSMQKKIFNKSTAISQS